MKNVEISKFIPKNYSPKGYHGNDAVLIVVLGGTGNLMFSKIAPSIYKIKNATILGCGKETYTNKEYFLLLQNAICRNLRIPRFRFNRNFEDKVHYLTGNFTDKSFYTSLQKSLYYFKRKNKNKKVRVIIYLVVSPELFPVILLNLNLKENVSIAIEKPFGNDEKSSISLNNLLLSKFKEDHIFRVEHYLAKEIVKNIYDFKLNSKYKNISKFLTKDHIDEIKITLIEKINVDSRGEFYDSVGAIRDVGQNHLLQMLALILCDNDTDITKSKINFLKNFTNDVDYRKMNIKLFQYHDYKEVTGVAPHSNTETAFKIDTNFLNGKYKGIKLFFHGGKSFNYINKGVEIKLKKCELNKIFIDIANSAISVERSDGEKSVIFLKNDIQKIQYVEEYSTLFQAIIKSEKDLFLDFEEIRHMWRFIDMVMTRVREEAIYPIIYKKGSDWRDLN